MVICYMLNPIKNKKLKNGWSSNVACLLLLGFPEGLTLQYHQELEKIEEKQSKLYYYR